jgi:hypothetical protein
MFFEVPDTGVGTGRGRIMVGDGSTTYVNLAGANNNTKGANSQAAKYFFPFTEDETIIHPGTSDKTVSASSSIGSSAVATYLNNAKSGNTLKTIIHNLREAIYRNACDIAMLNNDYSSLNSTLSNVTSYSGTEHIIGTMEGIILYERSYSAYKNWGSITVGQISFDTSFSGIMQSASGIVVFNDGRRATLPYAESNHTVKIEQNGTNLYAYGTNMATIYNGVYKVSVRYTK